MFGFRLWEEGGRRGAAEAYGGEKRRLHLRGYDCQTVTKTASPLAVLQEAGFKPNIQVFSALIGRAARRLDYVYLQTILKTMKALGVGPNEVIIKQLEFAAQYPPNYDQVGVWQVLVSSVQM